MTRGIFFFDYYSLRCLLIADQLHIFGNGSPLRWMPGSGAVLRRGVVWRAVRWPEAAKPFGSSCKLCSPNPIT